MTETWCPFAKRLPITTGEYYKVRGVPTISEVKHISAGTDSRGWLQNADNGASVHFLIRVENGVAVLYQFMPIEWAAWGNGRFSRNNPYAPKWVRDLIASHPNTPEGNRRISSALLGHTISTEHEGVTPTAALFTGPMLEMSIRLSKWLKSAVPTMIWDREHLIGHYQIDHIDRANCPGGPGGLLFPFDKILTEVNGTPNPPPLSAIQAYAAAHPEVGLPAEPNERVYSGFGDGKVYQIQFYEHDLLHARPDENGVWHVGRALTGKMLLERMAKLGEI
jgi:hypothetical protein